MTTEKASTDLLGRFNGSLVNKVFIQVDEVDDLHAFQDRLKFVITSDIINYEAKFKPTVKVQNYTNFLFTTNNENPINISTDDRRMVLFHCNSKYKGNSEYYKNLGGVLNKPEVQRAFYEMLMARDLSLYEFDMQTNKPETDYFRECQDNNIPVMSRFLSAVLKKPGFQGTEIVFMAKELFKMYMTFTSSGNYKSIKTIHMFAKELKKYPGVTSRHIMIGTEWAIDQKVLKDHLVHNKQLDDDVSYDFCQSAAW